MTLTHTFPSSHPWNLPSYPLLEEERGRKGSHGTPQDPKPGIPERRQHPTLVSAFAPRVWLHVDKGTQEVEQDPVLICCYGYKRGK